MTTKNVEQQEQEVAWTDLRVSDMWGVEKRTTVEVSSLKIQPSACVPLGCHGRLSGSVSDCWMRKTNKQELLICFADNSIKGCFHELYLPCIYSKVTPLKISRHHSDGDLGWVDWDVALIKCQQRPRKILLALNHQGSLVIFFSTCSGKSNHAIFTQYSVSEPTCKW